MRRLVALLPFAIAPALAAFACSNSVSSVAIDDDGGPADGTALDAKPTPNDAASDVSDGGTELDSSCPTPKTMPATGETCTGFGATSDPCDPACGLPAYGYVCFNGGPPGFTGCVQARASSLGDTYCCPKNDCVAEPDQDSQCNGVTGKPHLFQCPPDGTDGGSVPIPSGCSAKAVGGSPYAYACCP